MSDDKQLTTNANAAGRGVHPWTPALHRAGSSLALTSFVVAAVFLWTWRDALLPRSVDPRDLLPASQDIAPAMLALLPVVFLPVLWVFLVGVLKTLLGRPEGRWVAFGWGLLTLVGAVPVAWQLRQLADEPTLLMRTIDVWVALAATALLGSFLPAAFRTGLLGGLIVGISLGGGLGAASAVFVTRFGNLFGWHDANLAFVRSLEYGLLGGVGLGLLLGIGVRTGVITLRSDT